MKKRKYRIFLHIGVVAIAIGISAQVNAEEADAGAASGQPIIVTATKSLRDRADIPASVSVISEDEVRTSPAANVDDLLRSVPGVSVMRGTGIGQGMPTEIHIRGVAGDHRVLLLVDGLPLNESATKYLSLNEIPMHAVKQVEVIRGPFSSLFGTDAFGGVINIVTKESKGEPEGELIAGGGNGGLYQVGGSYRGGAGTIRYSLSADHRSLDNYLGRSYTIQRSYDYATQQFIDTVTDAVNYDYTDTRVLGKLSVDIGEQAHLALNARFFQSELGYGQKDETPSYPILEDNITKTRTALVGGRLTKEISPRFDVALGGYYRHQSRDVLGLDFSSFGAGGSSIYARSLLENETDDWQVEAGVDAQLGDSHLLSVGVDFRRNEGDFSPVMDNASRAALAGSVGTKQHIWEAGLHVQDEATLSDKWKAVAGARVDYHSEFGEVISPRAGILYDVSERTAVRASVGRAFRAPTLVELFQPTMSFGYVTFQSNPDLVAEYILSGDIEVEHQLTEGLTGTLALFYNDMDDLIENQMNGAVMSNVNINHARSVGVETGVKWRLAKGLDAVLSYTYQDVENTDTGAGLDYAVESTGSAGLRASRQMGRWQVEGQLTEFFVGARGFQDWSSGQWHGLDEYWRTDVSLNATLDKWLRVGVNVLNATDEKYQESQLIALAPGRLVSFEIGTSY